MNYLVLNTLLFALLGTALVSGLLFVFSNCVMKALSQVSEWEGIRVMRAINRVILNPLFFLVFAGTTALSLFNIVAVLSGWGGDWPDIFMVAACLYFFGTFLVTARGNVPMNQRLDAVDPKEAVAYWEVYLVKWTRLNHLRTAASALSVFLYGVGFIQLNFID